MKQVFADISFYQALLHKKDRWHEVATAIAERTKCIVLTTEYVLIELGGLMSRGQSRSLYVSFIERARLDETTTIVPASADLFAEGLSLFASRRDKEWSMTDCISFVLMKQHGIEEVLTTDHHFEQAGFTRIILT